MPNGQLIWQQIWPQKSVDKSLWESLSKLNNIKKDNEDNSIHLCKENGICITDAVLRDKIASQFGLSVEESCLIGKA